VKLPLVADHKVIHDDEHSADHGHEERFISQLTFGLVDSPDRVGQQAAAYRD